MNTYRTRFQNVTLGVALSVGMLPAIWSADLVAANLSGADIIDYEAYPVTTLENVTPQVMLTMSNDHQYFSRAFNDFTDLDDDGDVDVTYKNSFEYYGYFDPDKCYDYESKNYPSDGLGTYNVFVPKAFAVNHYCDTVSGAWSGNFLNWVAMTRMDIVRKILYGGLRATDTGTDTVLERAHLPTDTHSYTKYYNGADLGQLTPFSTQRTDTTNGGDNDNFDDANEGITICNTTVPSNTSQSHQISSTTNPPVMRVAAGNWRMWSAGEVFECHWKRGSAGTSTSIERGRENGNNVAFTQIDAGSDSPVRNTNGLTAGGAGPDFSVFVEVCVPGLINNGTNKENCRQYPSNNYKPGGLLQEYGDNIDFGLLTGSYQKNISGGVLRKNIGSIDDEINTATDGTFVTSQYSNTATIGIIRTLDKLRIFGYRYEGGDAAARYFNTGSSDNCGFQGATINEDDCNSWGNPISEIYAETIRYFAGLTATPAFAATDHNRINGLAEASWVDPLDSNNFCASLNAVVFNASLTSYDEGSAVFTDIPGASSPVTLTDAVGDAEGFTGNNYFVGRTGPKTSPSNATNDEFCTGKTVTNLGNVAGICPEGPTVDGTFHIAGMAHYAHTNDLRPDLPVELPPDQTESNQTVTTYAVQLATNVPKFEIDTNLAVDSGTDGNPTNDADVTILPAYRLVNNDGGGTLVDFKVVQKNIEVAVTSANWPANPHLIDQSFAAGELTPTPGTGIFYGKAMVQWEDSEQGGDYDMDQWGVISYIYDSNTQQVSVITDLVFYASNNGQLFGFIISGTTQDGFHAYSGAGGSNGDVWGARQVGFQDPDPTIPDCLDNPNRVNGLCYHNNSADNDPARSHTFTVGGSGANLLPDPLFLAAKYGAFEDSNGNNLPDLESEYDKRDKTGNTVAGGDLDNTPDTYFFVTNPSALEQSLRAVFNQIIERVASGTAASVVASEQEGTGALFQALYDPIKSDNTLNKNEVKWIGTLHAIFIDPNGLLREDSDDDDKLDGYDVDKVIEIFYDENERRARLERFTSSSATVYTETGSSIAELNTLNPIWNAREQLSAVTNVTTQRIYSDLANTGRHILTWLDTSGTGAPDGIVNPDQSEIVAFDTATITDANFGWVDVWDGVTLDDDEADKLVNYIRGEEQTGYRSRTVDYDGDGSTEVMRLGDIVNSTPTVQAAPAEAFDIIALDSSYSTFRQKYRNRRSVVYVGANDGMIHAFNGGFFDVTASEFRTSLTSEVAHPLGSELWAYIPKNLLGHLQWLTDQGYGHVFYNDLKPRIFDAKVFNSDTDHPGGWGTVMVVGMRLGGGHDNNGIILDTQHDGIGPSNTDNDTTDDVLTKSSYVVFDITNPEVPPKVIAELSPPTQFFTTGVPAVALIGAPVPTSEVAPPNDWILMFGSGPTDLGDVDSSQTGRVFAYDLRELVLGNHGVIESGPFDNGVPNDGIGFADTGDTDTFVGEITVADQDLDMKAEAIYFGTVGGEDGIGGNLYRLSLNEDDNRTNWGAPFKLLDVDQPFSTRPSITIDRQFRTWILAGTGRLYTNDDKESTATQTLYGFIDQYSIVNNAAPFDDPANPVAMLDANFEDVTNAVTRANGTVDLDGGIPFEEDTTFDAFESTVAAAGGWKLNYEFDPATIDPAERSVSNLGLLNGIVLSTAFTPSTELCGAEGESRIIGRAFFSGLVPPGGVFGQICVGCPDGEAEAIGSISLGKGLASSPSIHIGNQDVPGKVTVIVQQSTGAITGNEAQTLGGLNNGEVSWQEFRTD